MEKGFQKSFGLVFRQAKNAAKELSWTITYEDPTKGLIEASTESSILSWGETVKIRVERVNAITTKVSIVSAVNSQIFSWGKDASNESEFIQKIKALLGE